MIRVLEAAECRVFAPSAIDLSLGLPQLETLAAVAKGFRILRPSTTGETVAGQARFEGRPRARRRPSLTVVDLCDPLFAGDLADFGVEDADALDPRAVLKGLESSDALGVAVLQSKLHTPHRAGR